MSTNVWHDAFKDPPKEEGELLGLCMRRILLREPSRFSV